MYLQKRLVLIIGLFVNGALSMAVQFKCEDQQLACGCGFKNVEIDNESNKPEYVVPFSWSMIVSIRYDCNQNGNHSAHCCTGTILNEQYIVTAATCFNSIDHTLLHEVNISIAAGTNNLLKDCAIIRAVDRVIFDPTWTFSNKKQHKLVMLRVTEPFNFKSDVVVSHACYSNPTKLPKTISNYTSSLALVGWNIMNKVQENEDRILQQLIVYPAMKNDSLCPKTIYADELLFCVERHGASCFSDIGSSLFQWNEGHWYLIGIQSYSKDDCLQTNYKGPFIRLDAYEHWIKSILNSSNTTLLSPESKQANNAPAPIFRCNRTMACGCGYKDVIIQHNSLAKDHSWSMIVSIYFQGASKHFCSGTLLSSSYILTAAQCVDQIASGKLVDVNIIAGITNRSDTNGYLRKVNATYIHPNYTRSRNFLNDIGLLRIHPPLHFRNNPVLARTCVKYANLSILNNEPYLKNGTRLVIIGWNILKSGEFVTVDFLRQMEVDTIDKENPICQNIIVNDDIQFCAVLHTDEDETCIGDTGGPILHWTGSYWEQVGILGSNISCGTSSSPVIYTRLSYYWQWMEDILSLTNEHLEPQTPSPLWSTTTITRSTITRTRTTKTRQTTSKTSLSTTDPLLITTTVDNSTSLSIDHINITSLNSVTSSGVVPLQNTSTISATAGQITYDCNRIFDECGCSMMNVTLSNQNTLPSHSLVEDSYPYSWSMVVSIRVNGTQYKCMGTILSNFFILTVAQCVSNRDTVSNISIVAGIHNLAQEIQPIYKVAQVYIHENYSFNGIYTHDIAILRLEQSLELEKQALFSKTCLSNTDSTDFTEQSILVAVGWKHSSIMNHSPNFLQQVSIKPIGQSRSVCYNSLYDNRFQFCASSNIPETDTCENNFGEAVFMYRDDYWEQIGMLSNTRGCRPMGHSGIYIRLSPYTEWIQSIMQNTKVPMRRPIRRNKGSKQMSNNIFLGYIIVFYLNFVAKF